MMYDVQTTGVSAFGQQPAARGASVLYLDGVVGLALLAFWIFCLVDVICTPGESCRNLPKVLWLIIVIFLSWIGSVLWLIGGRPKNGRPARSGFYEGSRPQGYPEYERLGRAVSADPEADAAFLRLCRERAEEQRQRYQQNQRDSGNS